MAGRLGFRFGKKLTESGKNSGQCSSWSFYRAQERASSQRRSRRRRQQREEAGHGFVLASMREEGMRTTPSPIFLDEGLLGCALSVNWAALVGSCWAAEVGCGGQVSQVRCFSLFLFCFYFLFSILLI
jgi:hypothetical protein